MALFNCNLRISQTNKIDTDFSPSYADLTTETPTPSTFKGRGVIAPGLIASQSIWQPPTYPITELIHRWTASSISGYLKLTTAFSRINKDLVYTDFHTVGVPFPEYSAWEKFATDAGALDNFVSDGNPTTFAVTAWKDVAGASAAVTLEIEIFHRDAGGTETSLLAYTHNINVTTATQFTKTVNITQTFGTNERIVWKGRFNNGGIV